MKTVSLREFQLNATKYLGEEITLTRYNKPIAVVTPIGDFPTKKILKKNPEVKVAERVPVTVTPTDGPRGFEKMCSLGSLCGRPAAGMRDGYYFCKEHL